MLFLQLDSLKAETVFFALFVFDNILYSFVVFMSNKYNCLIGTSIISQTLNHLFSPQIFNELYVPGTVVDAGDIAGRKTRQKSLLS